MNFGLKGLTQRLLEQGYRYHKLRETFSELCGRCCDLISEFQVGLESLLRRGLSGPRFCGGLVFGLKKIVGSNNFSAQFIKVISHYIKIGYNIGYNINVLQQTACLVVNPITVSNFTFLFNCTPQIRLSLCWSPLQQVQKYKLPQILRKKLIYQNYSTIKLLLC